MSAILPNSGRWSFNAFLFGKLKIIFLFSIDSSIASCYYANLCHVSLLLPYLLTGTIVCGV